MQLLGQCEMDASPSNALEYDTADWYRDNRFCICDWSFIMNPTPAYGTKLIYSFSKPLVFHRCPHTGQEQRVQASLDFHDFSYAELKSQSPLYCLWCLHFAVRENRRAGQESSQLTESLWMMSTLEVYRVSGGIWTLIYCRTVQYYMHID